MKQNFVQLHCYNQTAILQKPRKPEPTTLVQINFHYLTYLHRKYWLLWCNHWKGTAQQSWNYEITPHLKLPHLLLHIEAFSQMMGNWLHIFTRIYNQVQKHQVQCMWLFKADFYLVLISCFTLHMTLSQLKPFTTALKCVCALKYNALSWLRKQNL